MSSSASYSLLTPLAHLLCSGSGSGDGAVLGTSALLHFLPRRRARSRPLLLREGALPDINAVEDGLGARLALLLAGTLFAHRVRDFRKGPGRRGIFGLPVPSADSGWLGIVVANMLLAYTRSMLWAMCLQHQMRGCVALMVSYSFLQMEVMTGLGFRPMQSRPPGMINTGGIKICCLRLSCSC